MVGPKLFLSVVGAKLSLIQNFACHSKFRVCVRKPRGAFPLAGGDDAAIKVGLPPWLMPAESPLKFRAGPIYPKLPTEADALGTRCRH